MVKFFSILKDSETKVAFHPKPKGIIQFIGGFVFGSFPECSYKYLFQHLYEKGYSLIVYPFPFDPFQFNHWSVAIDLLIDLYKVRVEIIRELKKCGEPNEQLEFYANDANYFWLGHSLGCKYILLLEILSDNNTTRRDSILRSCMPDRYSIYRSFVEDDGSKISQEIERVEEVKEQAIEEITKLIGKPCQFGYFIQDQPSLLLAPEINNTVQVFNIPIRPPSRLGFPNRDETQCLIRSSTELFNLMGLISFNLDGIARDDVDFLAYQLQVREFIPFLHKTFFGYHFEPQGIHVEHLVSCIDLILQELRKRQRQGIAESVQCKEELSCGKEIEISSEKENTYDLIVVGSGNGACGFLSKYLEQCDQQSKILVLESGKNFFDTSDITHQNNWTKSYAEEEIFQLHNAQTTHGIPIISGRANTMGGGGSINYAMIYESSSWLSTHFGYTEEYWENLKQELNHHLNCLNPWEHQTELTKYILQAAKEKGFNPQNPNNPLENPPSYRVLPNGNSQQLYLFATQFNSFGQRVHSGVSLVDWERIELKTQCQVTQLKFEEGESKKYRCRAVRVKYLNTGKTDSFLIKKGGVVILCAGAATPRLLMPHREKLNNHDIGNHVSDHIAIPIGIYLLNKKLKLHLTSKDNYVPIFATTEVRNPGQITVCSAEFFAGNFEKLWYFVSHLYLAFLLPNYLKRIMIRTPRLFNFYKGTIRLVIEKLNFFFKLWEETNLITAIIKFNPATEGKYESDDNRITLNFFETDQDQKVAKTVISEQLSLMERLADKPHPFVQLIFQFLGIPYNESQVNKYLARYSKKYLLSQQHMSGGCLFGKAISPGKSQQTGKVKGSTNVHVADLSASPLPRISPQMTAYLIGFHVASQLNKGETI